MHSVIGEIENLGTWRAVSNLLLAAGYVLPRSHSYLRAACDVGRATTQNVALSIFNSLSRTWIAEQGHFDEI
jgi:hypothetical protein